MSNDLFHNDEGYADPTAGKALTAYEKAVKRYERDLMKEKEKENALENKKYFLIKVLKFIINESGFELIGRIQLRDKETGKEFR